MENLTCKYLLLLRSTVLCRIRMDLVQVLLHLHINWQRVNISLGLTSCKFGCHWHQVRDEFLVQRGYIFERTCFIIAVDVVGLLRWSNLVQSLDILFWSSHIAFGVRVAWRWSRLFFLWLLSCYWLILLGWQVFVVDRSDSFSIFICSTRRLWIWFVLNCRLLLNRRDARPQTTFWGLWSFIQTWLILLLTELIKIRVCVADFVSVSLFFSRNSVFRINTGVINHVLGKQIVLIHLKLHTYIFSIASQATVNWPR